MNLTEFYDLNQSGTRVRLQSEDGDEYTEFTTDKNTDTDDYEVIAFDAMCEDLIKVWVKKK